MKTCSRCRDLKPLNLFVKSTSARSGFGSHCLDCDRERVAERRKNPEVQEQNRRTSLAYRAANLEIARAKDRQHARDRQQWVNTLKAGPCMDCQAAFPPCSMDFDHVRGVKFKGVGRLYGYKKETILHEIAKCDLVCACCHRVRTAKILWGTENTQRQQFHSKIAQLKTGPCTDCGGHFPAVAMDFDHVETGKVDTIARLRGSSWDKVEAELSKCELVCANCHRIRTQARKIGEAA